jgi:hypothetical protein
MQLELLQGWNMIKIKAFTRILSEQIFHKNQSKHKIYFIPL